ncbi:MAG TPA: hypothetical protein VH234_03990 [Candidatus Saccharimonadales bacterium]|nr:hypothetical protein [Candidatus Saccharimonadales bacterium]
MTKVSNAKLQVPVNDLVLGKLKQQAEELGFDSVQAYVRFWIHAAIDGRAFMLAVSDMSLPEVQAIRYIELMLATRHNKPKSLPQALNLIIRDLKRIDYKKVMEGPLAE